MKHPLKSQAKLVLAQPFVILVVGPVVLSGFMEVANQQHQIRKAPDRSAKLHRAITAFGDGVSGISLFVLPMIMAGARMPTPTLNDEHLLVYST